MSLPDLPHDVAGLGLIVLMLGARHGFDADHLAAIDGLARGTARHRPRLARFAGTLFSLGHGVVVIAVALAVSLASTRWEAPSWLEAVGAWSSIVVLLLLALANAAAVFATPADRATSLVGWRCVVFSRLLTADRPVAIAAVGMLFALSFDTVGQAALFAVTATDRGGWPSALLLSLLFLAGMLVVDGVDGAWLAHLVARADRLALVASRTMALAVAGVSLLVAGLGVARRMETKAPALPFADGSLAFGVAVTVIVFLSYVVGQRLAGGAHTRAVPRSIPCETGAAKASASLRPGPGSTPRRSSPG